MKCNAQGFSLMECLVYLVLVSLVFMLTMHWLTASQQRAALHTANNSKAITMHTAGDLLARDLMQALNQNSLYIKTDKHLYVWSGRDRDIGWELKDSLLIRSEGSYDGNKQTWKKVTRALIAEGIEEFSLCQNAISAITYCIVAKDAHCTVQRSIMLRSRIVT